MAEGIHNPLHNRISRRGALKGMAALGAVGALNLSPLAGFGGPKVVSADNVLTVNSLSITEHAYYPFGMSVGILAAPTLDECQNIYLSTDAYYDDEGLGQSEVSCTGGDPVGVITF